MFEMSTRQVRIVYGLDLCATPYYCKRPPCMLCGRSVVGHSFHHLPTGVICHRCLFGGKRYAQTTQEYRGHLQAARGGEACVEIGAGNGGANADDLSPLQMEPGLLTERLENGEAG